MKKVNISKLNNIKKSEELSQSRKDIFSSDLAGYLHNYDSSQNAPISLVHFVLKNKPSDEVKCIAIQNYYINLISLWETFFRDLFVLTMNIDEGFSNFVHEKYLKNYSSENGKEDLLALACNFQNITDINEAFSYVLGQYELLDYIGSYKQNIFLPPNLIENFVLNESFVNWKEEVLDTFSLRHKFVHDANYRHDFNLKESESIEWVFNIVPKLFANIIADRYELDRFTIDICDDALTIMLGRGKFNYISGVGEIVDFENSFIPNLKEVF
jgi:hypothetical protein